MGGVGFRKGCYVARRSSRACSIAAPRRRRVLIGHRPARTLPAAGTELTVAAAGWHARLDRRHERSRHCPHRQGQGGARRRPADHGRRRRGIACHPGWAKFTFPRKPSARRTPDGGDRPARRHAPGSACCRAAGSTCSTPRRSTSRFPISPMASPASRAGTARPAASMPFRWRSIRCWSKRSSAICARGFGRCPAGRPAARRARICHRRHDLAVQVGDGRRLQGRARSDCSAPSICASALPPNRRALRKDIKRADQIAAYFEATLLAGFSTAEATEFFGRPRGITADGFDLHAALGDLGAGCVPEAFSAIEKLRAGRA
jgi:hypothetical protein